MSFLRQSLIALCLTVVGAGAVHAETANERAILNSIRLVEHLHSTVPPLLKNAVAQVADGTYKRLAPEFPVWLVETINGSILYYQGEEGYSNASADRLVDDQGIRFGLKALQYGRASKSGWITMTLGGSGYRSYCKSQYPFVACTVVPM